MHCESACYQEQEEVLQTTFGMGQVQELPKV